MATHDLAGLRTTVLVVCASASLAASSCRREDGSSIRVPAGWRIRRTGTYARLSPAITDGGGKAMLEEPPQGVIPRGAKDTIVTGNAEWNAVAHRNASGRWSVAAYRSGWRERVGAVTGLARSAAVATPLLPPSGRLLVVVLRWHEPHTGFAVGYTCLPDLRWKELLRVERAMPWGAMPIWAKENLLVGAAMSAGASAEAYAVRFADDPARRPSLSRFSFGRSLWPEAVAASPDGNTVAIGIGPMGIEQRSGIWLLNTPRGPLIELTSERSAPYYHLLIGWRNQRRLAFLRRTADGWDEYEATKSPN